jgi:hypothetical protein
MKSFFYFFIAFILSSPLRAGTELEQVNKDLASACNISNEARKLQKQKKYQKDPNALNLWIQDQMKSKIKTEDILKLSATVGLVDERTRENVWRQTADDLGVPEWKCPGIGEFL